MPADPAWSKNPSMYSPGHGTAADATQERSTGRVSQSLGRPLRLSHGDIVRWRGQVLVTGTCHVWMGAVGSDGYGRIAVRNREDGARTLTPHQVGARLGYGPIPAGATVLHDCEVRLCCRAEPGHLRVARRGGRAGRTAGAGPAAGRDGGHSRVAAPAACRWPGAPRARRVPVRGRPVTAAAEDVRLSPGSGSSWCRRPGRFPWPSGARWFPRYPRRSRVCPCISRNTRCNCLNPPGESGDSTFS
jgi:hypothetical protein